MVPACCTAAEHTPSLVQSCGAVPFLMLHVSSPLPTMPSGPAQQAEFRPSLSAPQSLLLPVVQVTSLRAALSMNFFMIGSSHVPHESVRCSNCSRHTPSHECQEANGSDCPEMGSTEMHRYFS